MPTQNHCASNNQPEWDGKQITIGGAGATFKPLSLSELVEVPFPFADFQSPEDIGLTPERLRQLSELARPRASEA